MRRTPQVLHRGEDDKVGKEIVLGAVNVERRALHDGEDDDSGRKSANGSKSDNPN